MTSELQDILYRPFGRGAAAGVVGTLVGASAYLAILSGDLSGLSEALILFVLPTLWLSAVVGGLVGVVADLAARCFSSRFGFVMTYVAAFGLAGAGMGYWSTHRTPALPTWPAVLSLSIAWCVSAGALAGPRREQQGSNAA